MKQKDGHGVITGRVEAICVSDVRGIQKKMVPDAEFIPDFGIKGDAHAGKWHRQVSILAKESIDDFREKGIGVHYGDFGENMVVSGIPVSQLPVGSRFTIGSVLIEITQIGKACHKDCAIRQKTGDCIMPREGVFGVVLRGGTVHEGDKIRADEPDPARPFSAAIITLSDRAYAGTYEDKSGPAIREVLEKNGYQVLEQILLPDDEERLEEELKRLADQREASVIFTTGGTGLSDRDRTPEATEAVSDRMVPGIGEALRAYSMQFTPNAMLSRQTAGIRKHTLIINLPGSPKACREDLELLMKPLGHGLGIIRGTADN
ncbi:MAG: molybdopterin adenylyltransferase [Eubacteriales bacterium]|jgi:molybdopterin adenylyltransferase